MQVLIQNTAQAGATIQARSGTTYAVDLNGYVTVSAGVDLLDLLEAGFTIPVSAAQAGNNFRNLIDGGDFTVNPWQRGTSFTAIAGTLAYTADRWAAKGGASSSISVSRVPSTVVPGFVQALQFGRAAANADTTPINLVQILESADSVRCQGQPITLSFWAAAGPNFSGGTLGLQVVSGTGADQSATSMLAGAWTGQANVINASQALTSGMVRYSVTGTVPAGVTQLGVQFSYTPAGIAGANDWVQLAGIQLESSGRASAFEHRDVQVELEICQRYCWVINEPAAGVIVGIGGCVAAANAQVFYLATPVQLRTAPTVTVNAGAFKVAAGAAAAAPVSLAPGSTHTPNAISITSANTQSLGGAASLQGGGGAGSIIASADYL